MFEIKWILENLKGKRLLLVTALFFTIVISCSYVTVPAIMSDIIDSVLRGEQFDKSKYLFILIITIVLARTSLKYGTICLFEHVSQSLTIRLRNKLYTNLQKQDIFFYNNNRVGDLMTRMTSDLEMIRHFVAYVVMYVLDSCVILIISIVYLMPISWLLTSALLLMTPIMLFFSYKLGKKIRPMFTEIRNKYSDLNAITQENISGNRVVKAFSREKYEIDKFSEKNEAYREAQIGASMVWLKYSPKIEMLSQLVTVFALFLGSMFVITGQITIGNMSAFTTLTWTLVYPMRMMGQLINDTQRFFASAEKVISVYYAQPDIENPPDPVFCEGIAGDIEFKNTTLKFDDKTVLNNINLKINAGETIGIIGPTGSSKTSLINLISRFYDVTSGSVMVDGIDVRRYDLATLRRHIGTTTQDVFLFSDTVEGNIAFGAPDIDVDSVEKYAKMASADFIEQMTDGFDTIIGERGVGLSGGQKQRIALARALAISPSILILDDTTSAVDMETEKIIQESLDNLDYKCTKLIIAQRISSVRNADRIIVIQNGELVESGTHDELISLKGYYYEIFKLQHGEYTSLDSEKTY